MQSIEWLSYFGHEHFHLIAPVTTSVHEKGVSSFGKSRVVKAIMKEAANATTPLIDIRRRCWASSGLIFRYFPHDPLSTLMCDLQVVWL